MRKKLFTLLLAFWASIGTMNAVKIGSLYYYLNNADKTANVIKPEDGSIYDLVNVSIPSSVTYAYEGQESVTYTVEGIARYAFEDCTSLTSLTLPNTIKGMGDEAFCRCTGLTSVIIPNSVTYMGWSVFSNCTNLASIELSTNLSEIGLRCFADCKSLTSITIPSSLEYIEMVAFTGCSSLVSVTIPEGVKKIGDSAFNGCSSLIEIIIPNSVTEIGASAFRDCESLASVTIGKGITTFGGSYYEGLNVFENCTNITSVVWNAINANGDGLFSSSAEQLTSFVFGDEVQTISNGLCRSMIGLTSINIPNSVISIGNEAFSWCFGLTSVTIPNSVTSIGNEAFSGCSGLTSVTIPNSVTSIGESAFENCIGLTSVTIPNSVTSIGNSSFRECSGLTSINIPNSVTSIGNSSFRECSGLTSVDIPNSVTSIGNEAFYGCSSMTSVTIPNSVISIGNNAFQNCSSMTSVAIGNSVTSIGNEAFRDCSSMTSVTIGNSVTCIGDYAFFKCSSLTSVTIPNSVTSIGNSSFYECIGLKSLTIPEGVQSVEEYAFYKCTGLSSLTIGKDVTTIGSSAFDRCAKISSIKCEAVNPPLLGSNVFYSIKKSTPLYVPAASVDVYKTTDKWKDFTNIILILTETDLVNAGFDTEHNIVLCINLAGDAEVCNDIYYVGSANNWGKGNGNVEAYANCTKFDTLQNFGNWFIAEVPFSNGAQGMPIQAREDGRWSMFNQCGDKDAWYHIEEKSASISNDENNDPTIVYPSAGAYIYQLNYWKEHRNPCIGGDCGINLTWALDQEDSVLTISGTGNMNSVTSKNSVPWYNYSTAIKTIYLPDSITGINNYAFSDCSNVTSMFCGAIVPPTVNSTNTFKNINKAIPVYVPYASMGAYKIASNWKTFTNIKPIGECETLHGECGDEGENVQWNLSCDGELSLTGAGSMVSSGWKLDSIPWKAYFDYIKTIHISDSITYISNYAFKDGYNVTSITCKATTPPSVTSTYVFTNINKSIPVYVPEESVAAYKSASIWKTFTNILPIDDGMFTVEFIDWNGTILKKDKVAPYSAATAPADPEREGYTFTGWDKEFSSVTANLTVTAQYKINRYAVTFVDWDEAILKKDSVDYGSAATAPANPEREGYTFTGWDKDFSNVTENMTIMALYEQETTPQSHVFIYDLTAIGLTISDWTVNNATLNEQYSTNGRYAYDIVGGDVSLAYVTAEPRIQFQYTSLADKTNAFYLYPSKCFEFNGKNGILRILDTAIGDTIRLNVAAKGSNAANFEGIGYPVNATALTEDLVLPAKNSEGADANGYVWRTLEYVSQGGDVEIKEFSAGYRLRLIEIVEGQSNPQPASIIASGTFGADDDNLTWELSCDSVLSITGTGSMGEFDMSPWFDYNSYIAYVSLPDGLTSIGGVAFYNCSGLTSVTIPNSVTSIGERAFYNCTGLTSPVYNTHVFAYMPTSYSGAYTIPDGIESIAGGAFYNCSGLTSVTIPNSVTSIGSSAFYYCTNLTSVTIGNSVTRIGSQAFRSCSSLTSVTIPNSVTSIEGSTFFNCSSLTSVTIPNSVTSIGSNAFSSCPLRHLIVKATTPPNGGLQSGIPNATCTLYVPSEAFETYANAIWWEDFASIRPIGSRLFVQFLDWDNSVLKIDSVDYGSVATAPADPQREGYTFTGWDKTFDNVTEDLVVTALYEKNDEPGDDPNPCIIASGTFGADDDNLTWELSCDSVLSITGTGSMGEFVRSPWYDYNSYIAYVSLPDGLTSIGGVAFSSCSSLTSVTIPNSVTSIGDWAFEHCSGLTSVSIGNSVTSIGGSAFDGCTGLTSVTIPNSVTSIGSRAFVNCSSLISVTIGNSVTSIGESAFRSCSSLTSVTIPNSVTSIGGSAFSGCSGLTSVTIPNSVTSIGGSAFSGCSGLTSVTIGNSVTSIGNYAFYGCSSLTSVTIPNSVTSIGNSAFRGCSGLTSVTIPNSVTSIEQLVFGDCSGLTSVTIPNSVTSIGYEAFAGCSSLTAVTIPNSVTRIREAAFENCSGLTSVTIGNSVTSIESRAFAGCSSLTSVTIPNSVTSIIESAFYGCSGLTSVTIGRGITSIGEWAFYDCPLQHLIVKATTPPDGGVSSSIPNTTCILYVPSDAVDTYANSVWWEDFAQIRTLDEAPDPEPQEPGVIITRDILDLSVDGITIDDWTINDATINDAETDASKKKYVFDVAANIPSIDYVTSKPRFQFQYGNSADKTKAFFIYPGRFYETGGKNGLIHISNTQSGDTIKLEVAAKGSTAGNFGDPNNVYPINATALTEDLTLPAKGSAGADANGYVWRTLEFLSQGGDVTLKEVGGGYRVRLIEVIHVEVEHSIPTGILSEEDNQDNLPYKILRDGHIYILRDGKTYTLQGQLVL